MLRYLGMMWDDASPQQREAAQSVAARLQLLGRTPECSGRMDAQEQRSPGWQQAFAAPGVQIFCAGAPSDGSQVQALPNAAGVVIGTLFSRNQDVLSHGPDEQLRLTPLQSKAFVQSRGHWLIDHAWGNYVAFGRDAADGCKWVLKDPTGSLPCLRTHFRGVDIFFSRMGDCVELRLLRFSVNQAFLNAHLVAGSALQALSPLNEVSPVRRGECVMLEQRGTGWNRSSKYYWSPLTFRGADALIEDPSLAARAMRSAVKGATSSWASVHPSLLLRLSGGLDSSIIAGCLKDAGAARFSAYTYFSPAGRSDERPWARLAARHSGCEHIEYPISPMEMDLRIGLQMQPALEPSPLLGYMQRTLVEQELAARTQATGIFNGEGGDSGFCSDAAIYAVPEFLKNHGLAPGLFRLASQVALLTEKSSWSVLTGALQRRLTTSETGISRERILTASQLVHAEIKHAYCPNETISHPWFQGERRVPWDKIRRLGTLISTPEYYNVAAPADAIVPEIVSPLYAQPVMEMLLRIPIYTHLNGGRDRALARQAFVEEVPEPILRRLWKDRAPGFHDQLLERHRAFLRETLLEGVLARNGLLDRAMLEQALSAGPTKSTVYPGELFRHLDSELWARHWLDGSQQQAAA